MIRYIERNHIDEEKWNRCINNSFNGNLYGYSWFLDIVGGEWSALVENDYERIFPLVQRKKLGITFIYQPFFTQQLGLYSTTKLDGKVIADFLVAIPKEFKSIEINLNTHNTIEDKGFRIIPQLNHELDLINNYENIRKGYSENLQRNLKKAEKAGLSISKNIKPDDIIALFRENRGKDIGHLRDGDYLRLKRIAYTCTYKGIAHVQGIYDRQNQLVAGAFFIRSHKKVIFLFSGLSKEGRESAAMPFLIDDFIRHHAGQHLTFDFDGSNDPNLARFYKSFGSKECIYPRIEIDRLPLLLSLCFKAYRYLKTPNPKFKIPDKS